MDFFSIPRKYKFILWHILCAIMLVYFVFHIINGKRGFYRWSELQQEIEHAKIRQSLLIAEKNELKAKVKLLHPDSLDLDLLEEELKRMGLISNNEILLF